jgi:hypothetical protein
VHHYDIVSDVAATKMATLRQQLEAIVRHDGSS